MCIYREDPAFWLFRLWWRVLLSGIRKWHSHSQMFSRILLYSQGRGSHTFR